jgi:hypothetical protein
VSQRDSWAASLVALIAVALSLSLAATSCENQREAARLQFTTLKELAFNPSRFELGEEVRVEGFLIRPPRSATFVCDEISRDTPPRAVGHCIAMDRPQLSRFSELRVTERTRWLDQVRRFDCKVTAYLPGTPPERVVLSCEVQ